MIRCHLRLCRLSFHRTCIANIPSSLPPLTNPTITNTSTTNIPTTTTNTLSSPTTNQPTNTTSNITNPLLPTSSQDNDSKTQTTNSQDNSQLNVTTTGSQGTTDTPNTVGSSDATKSSPNTVSSFAESTPNLATTSSTSQHSSTKSITSSQDSTTSNETKSQSSSQEEASSLATAVSTIAPTAVRTVGDSLSTAASSIVLPAASESTQGLSTADNMTGSEIGLGKWMCPLHRCLVCGRGYVIKCKYCVSSYCKEHRNHLCYDISSPFMSAGSSFQHGGVSVNQSGSLDSSLSLTEREKRTLRRNCGVTSKEELDNYIKIVQNKDQLLDHPVEKLDSGTTVSGETITSGGRRKSATSTARRNSRNVSTADNKNSVAERRNSRKMSTENDNSLPARSRNSRNISPDNEISLSERLKSRNISSTKNEISLLEWINSRNVSTENSPSLDNESLTVSQKNSLSEIKTKTSPIDAKTRIEGNDSSNSSLDKLGDNVKSGISEETSEASRDSDVKNTSDENESSSSCDENPHDKNPFSILIPDSVGNVSLRTEEIESQETRISLTSSSSEESASISDEKEFSGKQFRVKSSIGEEIVQKSRPMISNETVKKVFVVIDCDNVSEKEDKLESKEVTKKVEETSHKKLRKSVKKDLKKESETLKNDQVKMDIEDKEEENQGGKNTELQEEEMSTEETRASGKNNRNSKRKSEEVAEVEECEEKIVPEKVLESTNVKDKKEKESLKELNVKEDQVCRKLTPEKLEQYLEKHNMIDCNVSLDEMNLSDTGKLLSPTIKQNNTSLSPVDKDEYITEQINDVVPTKNIEKICSKSTKEKSNTDEERVDIHEHPTVSPTLSVKTKKKSSSMVKEIDEQLDGQERVHDNLSLTSKDNSDSEKIDDQKVEINKEKESVKESMEIEPTSGKHKRKNDQKVEINMDESDKETTESTITKDKRKSGGGISKELKKLMIDMVVQANKHVIANVLEGSETLSDSTRPKRKSIKPKKDSSEWETTVLKKSGTKVNNQDDNEDIIEAEKNDGVSTKTNAEEKDVSIRKSQRKQVEKTDHQGIKHSLETENFKCEPINENSLDGTDTNKRTTRKSQRRLNETDDTLKQGKDKNNEHFLAVDANNSRQTVRNDEIKEDGKEKMPETEQKDKEKDDKQQKDKQEGNSDKATREETQENSASQTKRLLRQVSNISDNSEDSLKSVSSDGKTRRSLRQKQTVPSVKNDENETRIGKGNDTDSINVTEDSRDTESILSFESTSTETYSGRRKSSRITTMIKKENLSQYLAQDEQNQVDKTIPNNELNREKYTKNCGQTEGRTSLRRTQQNDSNNINEIDSKTDKNMHAKIEPVVFGPNIHSQDFEDNYITSVMERFNFIPDTKNNGRNSRGQIVPSGQLIPTEENTVGKLVDIIVSMKTALVSTDWNFLDDNEKTAVEFQGFEERKKEKWSDKQLLYPRLRHMRIAVLKKSDPEFSQHNVSKKLETRKNVSKKVLLKGINKMVPKKSMNVNERAIAREKVTLGKVKSESRLENLEKNDEIDREEKYKNETRESNVDDNNVVKSRRKSRRLDIIEKNNELDVNKDENKTSQCDNKSSEKESSQKTEEPIESLNSNSSVDTAGFKERRKSRRTSLEKRNNVELIPVKDNSNKLESLEKTQVKQPVEESNEAIILQEKDNDKKLAEISDKSEIVSKIERRQSRRLSLEKRNENVVAVVEKVHVEAKITNINTDNEVDKVIKEVQDSEEKLKQTTSVDKCENKGEILTKDDGNTVNCEQIQNKRRESQKTQDLEDMMELLHEETPTKIDTGKTETVPDKESSSLEKENLIEKVVVKSGMKSVTEGEIDKEKIKKRKISFSLDVHDRTREDAQPVKKKRKLSHRETSEVKVVIQTEEKENVLKKIMEEEQKELNRIQEKKKTIHASKSQHNRHEKTKVVEKHRKHHHRTEKERKDGEERMAKDKSKISGEREHRTPDKHNRHDKERSKSNEKTSSSLKSVKDRSSERTPDKCGKRESHDSKHRDKKRGNDKSDKHRLERSSSKSGEKVDKEKNEKTPEKKDNNKLEKSGDKVSEKSSEKTEDVREKPAPVSTSTPLAKPVAPPAAKLQPTQQPKPKKAAPKFFEDLENSMATYYADLAKKKKERIAKKQQMAASKPVVAKTDSSPIKPSAESKTKSQSTSASSKSSENRNTSSTSSSPPEKHPRVPKKSPLTPPPEKRLKPNPSETALSLSPSKTSSVDLPPKKNLLKKYTFNQDSDFESVQQPSSYPPSVVGTANMCTFSTVESKPSNGSLSSESSSAWSTGKPRLSSFDNIGSKLPSSTLKNIHPASSSRLSFDDDKLPAAKVVHTLSRDYKPHKSADRFSFMKTQFDEEFTAAYAETGVAMATEPVNASSVAPSNTPTLASRIASSVAPSNASTFASSNVSTFASRNASSVAPSNNVSPVKSTQLIVSPTKSSLESSFGSQTRLMGFPPQQTTAPNITLVSPPKTIQINVPSTSLPPSEETAMSTVDQRQVRVKRPNIKALCTRSQYVRSKTHSTSGLCSIQ